MTLGNKTNEELLKEIELLKKRLSEFEAATADGKKVLEILKQEQMFYEVINNMSSGVAIYEAKDNGEDFIFSGINKSGEHFSKVKREDIIGKSVLEFFPAIKEIGLFQVFQKVWKTGQSANHPLMLYKDNRISQWIENYVYKLPSGKIVAIYEDTTEHKQAEELLKERENQVRTKLDALLLPEGDIGTLDLADIIDVPVIQNMMNDFFALTGIGVAILDLNGKILISTGWQDICTKFHRVHPETLKHCMESDTVLSSGVEPNTFKRYRCRNNMWDIVTPITLGDRHVGNLFLGQFFFVDEKPDIETFCAQARQYGFDEAEYLAAMDRVPRWSQEKIEQVMTFYMRFAKLISELSYSNIKLARTLFERKKIEEILRQSEEKLRSVIDNIGIGVSMISPEMEILSLNKQMKQWYPHIDFKDKHICYRAFNNPPREEVCSYCPTVQTLKDGLVHEAVTETPMGDQLFNYRIISSPIKDDSGKVIAAIEMVEDITLRRKMELELKNRMHELEIFYKASIGREERIIELKKEVENLKNELKKN